MKKISVFIATGFGSGYIPFMPGTFGTVVGALVSILMYYIFGKNFPMANAILFAVTLAPAIYIAGKAETHFGVKDAKQIVIDEMSGFWLSILFHPFSFSIMIAAFILFRIFDIVKPFPICSIQKIRGGLGVVADDLVAAVYVNLILIALRYQAHYTGVHIL
jgi:phosphatidylglycerophosphatase A